MTTLDTRPITEPGLVHDMPLDIYLSDPVEGGSLSHSGAKTIVTKTPALFAYEREHGRPDKRTFDFGHAAHRVVLGVGPDIVAVDADSWRTNAAKDQAEAVRQNGGVPILRAEFDTVIAMADALRLHPVASKLIEAGSGQPEVSAFARDDETNIWLRCRFDWLRTASKSGRLLLVDYKSCVDASKDGFAKAAANYSYDLQDRFYSHVAQQLKLADDIAFLFVAQEKTPPYLVNVVQLDVKARETGTAQMRKAIRTYADCQRTGRWPGYGDEVQLLSLPIWHERKWEDEL